MSTTVERLADQARSYARRLVDRSRGSPALEKPLVSIEFDDGYRSAYEHGLPLLIDRNWLATVYIVTREPSESMDANGLEIMDSTAVLDWALHGCIGSHSRTHRDLTTLDDGDLHEELAGSKEDLERVLGAEVTCFAAPFGTVDDRVRAAVRKHYGSLRLLGATLHTPGRFDPMAVYGRSVKASTTDAELADLLRQTKNRRSWLPLVWHRLDDCANSEWTVSPKRFAQQLEIIEQSGIEVVSTAEAVQALSAAASTSR